MDLTEHPVYKRSSRDPVNPLIEFGMSSDGPHMYHNEKRCMYTVEQVQSGPELGTPKLEQKKVSHIGQHPQRMR